MVSPLIFDKLKKENAERISEIKLELSDIYRKNPKLLLKQEFAARKKLLYAEHQAIEKLLGEGVLSEEMGEQKKRSVLERLEILDKK